MSLSQLEKDFRDSYIERVLSLSSGRNKPEVSSFETQKSIRFSGDKFNFFLLHILFTFFCIILF
jgi:hypothetical protein